MRRLIITLLGALAAVIGLPATAADETRPLGPPVSAEELKATLADALETESSLREAVGLPDQPAGDHVTATVSGGLLPTEATVSVFFGHDRRWHVESVVKPLQGRRGHRERPVELRFGVLSPELSQRLEAMLSDDGLYQEPTGISGTSTDQPAASVKVAWKGRRREAARFACPPEDRTWRLLRLLWDAEEQLPEH